MRTKQVVLAVTSVLVGIAAVGRAQPVPGDVFREYMWWNEKGDAGGSFRVGGQCGEKYPDRGWALDYINAPVVLDLDFDLDQAIRGEVVIEKILCHDSTKGLAIEINGNPWIRVPEAEAIPYPQWEYQHHICPVVPVPMPCALQPFSAVVPHLFACRATFSDLRS